MREGGRTETCGWISADLRGESADFYMWEVRLGSFKNIFFTAKSRTRMIAVVFNPTDYKNLYESKTDAKRTNTGRAPNSYFCSHPELSSDVCGLKISKNKPNANDREGVLVDGSGTLSCNFTRFAPCLSQRAFIHVPAAALVSASQRVIMRLRAYSCL